MRGSLRLVLAVALLASALLTQSPTPVVRIWPHGGNPGVDSEIVQHVTYNGGGGCATANTTYHTCACWVRKHSGIDIALRTFGQQRDAGLIEQNRGVPVFAVADGTVCSVNDQSSCDECMDYRCASSPPPEGTWRIESHKGAMTCEVEWHTGTCPVSNAGCNCCTANHVYIEHEEPGGVRWRTFYNHLRHDSVPPYVYQGAHIKAGQQIGLVGSSGASHGPHTHFEIQIKEGSSYKIVDPFVGPCNQTPRITWEPGEQYDLTGTSLYYVGVSRDSRIATRPPQPRNQPGQDGWIIADADTLVHVWGALMRLPAAGASMQYRLVHDVHGTVTPTWSGEPWTVAGGEFRKFHQTLALPTTLLPGSWLIEMTVFAGTETPGPILTTYLPLEVISGGTPTNRNPYDVTATLVPAAPTGADAIECRVSFQTLPVVGDPDYDIVQFKYEWTVDGVSVRTKIHHGQGDAIPRQAEGSVVQCKVTPLDGRGGIANTAPTAGVTVAPGSLNAVYPDELACPPNCRFCSLDAGSPTGWRNAVDLAPGPSTGPRLVGYSNPTSSATRFEVSHGDPRGAAVLVLSTDPGGVSLTGAAPRFAIPALLDSHGQWGVQLLLPDRAQLFAALWVTDPERGAVRASNTLERVPVVVEQVCGHF